MCVLMRWEFEAWEVGLLGLGDFFFFFFFWSVVELSKWRIWLGFGWV